MSPESYQQREAHSAQRIRTLSAASPGLPSGEQAGSVAACSSWGPRARTACQAGAYRGQQLVGDSPHARQLLLSLWILQWDGEGLP